VLAAVMNRAAETPFSRGEEERIEALRRAPGAPAELAAAWHLVMRRRIQERQLARLARAMPVVTLPRLPVRRLGPRDIEELSRLLGGRLDALSRG